jgi:hypothetical protein
MSFSLPLCQISTRKFKSLYGVTRQLPASLSGEAVGRAQLFSLLRNSVPSLEPKALFQCSELHECRLPCPLKITIIIIIIINVHELA